MSDKLQLPSNILKTLAANAKIYKDECVYTFDTPLNCENGLDIDLITYFGYSRTPNHNFTLENYKATGNRYYLNINKTPKEAPRPSSPKMQKLQVIDVKEEDLYNTTTRIYDIESDKYYELNEISDDFNSLVSKILTSNSSNRDNEIKEWEQEIYPCAHSIDIQQDTSVTVNLSKCTQCDLKENLWICLHCGAIGCGRAQFGSTIQGNSHALAHYEATGHAVAVKLGSLSEIENSCDVYCYQDNDEVKVPNLAKKISTYGINLNESVKTEKSLIELNIDQNMNWDFNVDGDDSKPVFGPGLTGMTNLGNSCYLNSIIQGLFALPQYQKFFENFTLPLSIKNPAEDLLSQLIKLYDGLISGRYSKLGSSKGLDYQMGIQPSAFKSLIGENHPEFKTQKQQDAFEFLTYTLDKIDNELGLDLNESLKFLLSNKVICVYCKHGSINSELVDNISVQIKDEVVETLENGKKVYKSVNLLDSLINSVQKESIEGYKCQNCEASPGEAEKSTRFKSFPENLIINAQRIKLENWVPIKVDVPIDIPYQIDISHLVAQPFASDEVEVKKEEAKSQFVPNPEALTQLQSMGFPEARCIKGLYHTGNSSNAEDAMNWIFAHMEDIDIDEPLKLEGSSESKQTAEVPQELIENLSFMGFAPQLCKKALHLNNNNPNAAAEWLFNNSEDDGVIEETTPKINVEEERKRLIENLSNSKSTSGKYKISAIVCHKGNSPHTGHYVVFIRKIIDGEERWVLFNDEKVVVCSDDNLGDLKSNAYIYIFNRLD